MPNSVSFEEQKGWAQIREIGCARFIQKRGWYTLATYDFSGSQDDKAPKLHGPTESLVIPDLIAFRAADQMWFEVKAKTSATLFRKTGVWETGFSLRHFRHYQRVQEETDIPVSVLFVHDNVEPGDGLAEVRYAALDELDRLKRVYDGDKMGRGGMVFFPYYELRLIAHTSKILKLAS